jgi:hypothetical protein
VKRPAARETTPPAADPGRRKHAIATAVALAVVAVAVYLTVILKMAVGG